MAKLLSGTRIYGNAAVDTFITVGGTVYAGNIVVDSITANTWFRLYTANIYESLTNLFYTNSRVVSAVTPILTTANVVELNNQYFTNVRVLQAVNPLLTTANVLESNNNLYYTNSRVLSALTGANLNVNSIITNTIAANSSTVTNSITIGSGTGGSLTGANLISATNIQSTRWLGLYSGNVVESPTNLFFTPERVFDALLGNNVTVNNLVVSGDLEIQGNTVTVNTATLTVEDKNILLANGATTSSQADGAGITIAGADANITYLNSGDKFVINKSLDVTGNLNVSNSAFLNNDPVITLNPLNQSIAVLRSQLDAPIGNVIFVSGNGDDRNSGNSLANALANIHTALNKAEPWTTVFVKSGDYILYNQPVTIKRRVGMVGDNLRTTTIRPSERTKDMFYVNNACYVTGFTFRDHLSPAAVFSYNPDGSAGFITTSPYIQNSSSITTTGTGMRVDGSYVSGLRSMVVDSYTQTNEGGIGMHMLNRGYTQLVSVFTICCDIAILAENGGFASITNSNASFGRLGLVARGVSNPLNYGNFDRVEETDTGTYYVFKNLNTRPNYGDAVLFANYNKAKCERDTGLIVDSLAIDLAYGSNTQSTFAALQYWSQTESAIPNQSVETIAAIQYAKNLASNIAQNITITPVKQANVTQVSATAGNQPITVATEFDLIANIIQSGTIGVTDRIVPNRYPANTNVGAQRTANLLFLNSNFIAAETVAYIRQTYPGFFGNASYFIDAANSEATCTRDVGYIINSVGFDILHGGNRQAIMAGTYYYTYNANQTQINNQIVQTGAAYNFIGSIIDEIVRDVSITNSYQTVISQNTTAAPAATYTEANLVINNINLITNIIENGPSVAGPKRPISYTPSTNPDVINAAKNILANRDYIVAEVSRYVDVNWSNISNGSVAFYTVANASPLSANVSYVKLLETVTDETILANASVSFHQPSYISALGYTFEYIGSGTVLAQALPYAGGIPIQANEVTEEKGGRVYFTSTDQQGDFRIGENLVFNRVDGTITGRTFTKALFATMTPYILAIEG
jgi:hypothetical protein